MAAKIEKSTIIGDVLDIAPETAPLFMAIGMHCLGCRPPAARPSKRPAWSTASTAMHSSRRSTASSKQTKKQTSNLTVFSKKRPFGRFFE